MKAKSASYVASAKRTNMLSQLECEVGLRAPYSSTSRATAERVTLLSKKLSSLVFL